MANVTQYIRLLFRRGTQAQILARTDASQGEPYYATDTKRMYVADAASTFIPVVTTISKGINPESSFLFDLGSSTLQYRKIYAAEIESTIFAKNTITVIGGTTYITKNVLSLPTDLASGATTYDFGQAMTVGDFAVMKNGGNVEYISIGTLVSGTNYNINRNLDGSGANDWSAGTPLAVLGQSGNGRIELDASVSPFISMKTQGAAWGTNTELLRLGDLNGNWGYNTSTFGLAIGEYASSKANLVAVAGELKIRNYSTDVLVFSTTESKIENLLKMSGASSAISIGATPPTSASAGTGIWLDKTGMYGLASNVVQAKFDAATGAITAGAGGVTLSATGITLSAVVAKYGGSSLLWKDSGTTKAAISPVVDLGYCTNFAIESWVGMNITLFGGYDLTIDAQSVRVVAPIYFPSDNTHDIGATGANRPRDIYSARQFISQVATGTSPLSITSTTVCANLNADLLDGKHASEIVPAGTILPYGGSSAPSGYLLCDGSAVSRTTYATLFTAISTAYGTGDGSTTFNLPDLQGRMLVGVGTHSDVNALNKNDGLSASSRTPKHTHDQNSAAWINKDTTATTPIWATAASNQQMYSTDGDGFTTIYKMKSGVASNTPSFVTVNYIIKT